MKIKNNISLLKDHLITTKQKDTEVLKEIYERNLKMKQKLR
jgi:hypothetical protein